jgi:hypothetical protein
MILCGFLLLQQAAIGDCLSFDPFSFDENGAAPITQFPADASCGFFFRFRAKFSILPRFRLLQPRFCYVLAVAWAGQIYRCFRPSNAAIGGIQLQAKLQPLSRNT